VNVIDSAKEHAKGLASKVMHTAEHEPSSQSLTIGGSKHAVTELFQDAGRLSQVLGDLADVENTGPRRQRWVFAGDDDEQTVWECVVAADEQTIEFVDVQPDSAHRIVLELSDAPQDRGTEVIARVSSPAPGLLTGPLLFKALYRARALLQTGEVPTIEQNPSARTTNR
jgi:uncharacterized membrane protein